VKLSKLPRARWIAAAVAIVGATVGLSLLPKRAPKTLDMALWHDEASIENGVRQKLADQLVASGSLMGKSREEVVQLLGEPLLDEPPPPTPDFKCYDVVYVLGLQPGYFGIDHEWLVIRLGPDGCAAEARIVTD
jgi:hypothetical protein